MPKITRHGGPSNAAEVTVPIHEEVPSSAGISSSTSPEKPPTAADRTSSAGGKPARTMANRTGKARTGDSSARSTAIDPTPSGK